MITFNQSVREQLINFLETKLVIPNNGLWAHYEEDGCEDYSWYEDFRYECDADSIEHGATKIVLFYDEIPDWVVKIPCKGEYLEEEDEYRPFKGACRFFPVSREWDYCEGEVHISKTAFYAGLEEMFALTYFLFMYEDTPIYVSERVPKSRWINPRWKDEEYSWSIAKDISRYRKDDLYDSCLDEEVIAFLVDAYGEMKTHELIDFIVENDIRDLHNGNVGFTKDMKIKILDYSGFDS